MSVIYTMRQYYKSFALTIRPRAGITNDTINALKSWMLKLDYSVAVTEMTGEARHLHAQIWLNEGRTKDDVAKAVKRICERTISDWDATQSKVLRGGIRIAYSDWYLEYLVDNEEKGCVELDNIIINNPPDRTEQFYPTEEEQEKVKSVSNATDPRYQSLEIQYLDWAKMNDVEITMKSVAQFLCYAMFQQRTIKVITNQRDRTGLCKTLYAYISKSNNIELFMEKTATDKKFEKTLELVNQWQNDDNNDLPSIYDEEEFL